MIKFRNNYVREDFHKLEPDVQISLQNCFGELLQLGKELMVQNVQVWKQKNVSDEVELTFSFSAKAELPILSDTDES